MESGQKVRVNRGEMQSLRWLMFAFSSILSSQTELVDRLKMLPDGEDRLGKVEQGLESLMKEMMLTLPDNQRKMVKNTLDDMEFRMVPNMTPKNNRVVMDVYDLAYIVEAAKKDICMTCIYAGDECKQCKLYRILEGISPQKEWGDSTLCPYNREDWATR